MMRLIRLLCLALGLAALSQPALAGPICAAPGRDGIGISVTGVVNTYWGGATANVAVGAKSILLGPATGASTPIATGDLVLVIQMQDAEIKATNDDSYGDGMFGGVAAGVTALNQTGVYEYARAASSVGLTGGTLTLVGAGASGGLLNAYVNADTSLTRGQRRYQVIRVPQYSNLSIGAGLTASAWDGARGGVLAVDVAARLDLNGGVANVTGLGFRGGGGRKLLGSLGLSVNDYINVVLAGANGSKGEGVAGTPAFVSNSLGLLQAIVDLLFDSLPGGSYGRGAPGNAGGGANDGAPLTNTQNAGGGGGASYGSGGKGGNANCGTAPNNCPTSGGFGGGGISAMSAARVILGGGGGAGSNNSGSGLLGNGFGSSGAPGGGLVLIRAGVIAGTGSIFADGSDASNSVTNDGSGGGGGGGGILLLARELQAGAALSAFARGGAGGTNTGGGSAHGPGGGGGGGFIMSSLAAVANVTGGSNGLTAGATAYGSVSGVTGLASTNLGVGLSLTGILSGESCTPVLEKMFDKATIPVGAKARLTLRVRNNHPSLGLTGAAFLDTYPTGMLNAPVPNISSTCGVGATVIASAGTNTVQVLNAAVGAAAYCDVSVDVITDRVGAFLNKINAGGLVVTLVDQTLTSLFDATAPLEAVQPLVVTKQAVVISSPHSAVNPKAVPGAILEYTITVTNPSTSPTTALTLSNAIPPSTSLLLLPPTPALFTQGSPSSTLAYTFSSLGSTTDSLEFSKDYGATWTYAPAPAADGADAAVTNLRVRPAGSHAAGGAFTLTFRVRVK